MAFRAASPSRVHRKLRGFVWSEWNDPWDGCWKKALERCRDETMKYTTRPYQSENDLYEIGRLIRRAHARQNYFNAWSFCRFDIWSQRRIADAASFDDDLWQKQFRLMHDENGRLAGTAFAF